MREKIQERNNNIIKTINKEIANQLINCGYYFVVERVNDLDIYGFILNEDLERYVNSNFSSNDFFFEKRLRF